MAGAGRSRWRAPQARHLPSRPPYGGLARTARSRGANSDGPSRTRRGRPAIAPHPCRLCRRHRTPYHGTGHRAVPNRRSPVSASRPLSAASRRRRPRRKRFRGGFRTTTTNRNFRARCRFLVLFHHQGCRLYRPCLIRRFVPRLSRKTCQPLRDCAIGRLRRVRRHPIADRAIRATAVVVDAPNGPRRISPRLISPRQRDRLLKLCHARLKGDRRAGSMERGADAENLQQIVNCRL
jgi:hypothetical protein